MTDTFNMALFLQELRLADPAAADKAVEIIESNSKMMRSESTDLKTPLLEYKLFHQRPFRVQLTSIHLDADDPLLGETGKMIQEIVKLFPDTIERPKTAQRYIDVLFVDIEEHGRNCGLRVLPFYLFWAGR